MSRMGSTGVIVIAAVAAIVALAAAAGSSWPPYRTFVPRQAYVAAGWRIPPGGGVPPQVFVEWRRGSSDAPWRNEYALDLWQRHGAGWDRVYRLRLRGGDTGLVAIRQSDVTRDRHLDQVVTGPTMGSGGCGPRRVLAIVRGRLRQIFHLGANTCDTEVTPHPGGIAVSRGWYTIHDSHCCPTFTLVRRYAWRDGRLRRAATHLFWNCIDVYCRHWRRGPLHFVPRSAAFWDSKRGVAVGGARPWLIAFTRNAGHGWHIVDASAVPLGKPQLTRAGHGRIPFLRCGGRCNGYRAAVTSSYGETWTGSRR